MVAALLVLQALLGACAASTPAGAAPTTLRLGYFPNVTHATAVVGIEGGLFQQQLGEGTTLDAKSFNAGPQAVEALLSGGLDATYLGPNPAINAFGQSKGEAIRIIAGATSGGAFFVVKPGVTKETLKGRKFASPQLGGTQDVALRSWLTEQGLSVPKEGGGDVTVVPQENAQTLETFKSGEIDGAWVPEPWATRLILEGGGEVLVDERDLWPGQRYVTTHLIVRTEFLRQYPASVAALLKGHLGADALISGDAARAQALTNQGIEKVTGKKLSAELIAGAWRNLTFTVDPIGSSLRKSADDATRIGLLEAVDLNGIYDLGPLNRELKAAGRPEVAAS
jgi:NitT/TauT family transport system substrate-binding protein